MRLTAVKDPTPLGTSWRTSWRPRERIPLSEWAEKYIELPGSYALPGPFRTSINRPMIEPLNCVSDPSIREAYFQKPIQFGGTVMLDVAQPWIFLNDPGPLQMIMQTDPDMEEHFITRLKPLFERCKPMRQLLNSLPARQKRNDALFFGAFFALYTGANEGSLQRNSIRWLLCDELWMKQWQPLWVHARGRVTAYERAGTAKIFGVSQAGNVGDIMDQAVNSGTMEQWCYLATNGKHAPLLEGDKAEDGTRWGLIWNEDARISKHRWNIARACETARYVCKETGQTFADTEQTRQAWNAYGSYVATNLTAPRHIRSFMVNALLNRPLAELVREKLDAVHALASGNPGPMADYRRKRLALPWQDKAETITLSGVLNGYQQTEYMAGEKWAEEVDRCMTIDRQHGRAGDVPHWWVCVTAFSREGKIRVLRFCRVETIEAVRELQTAYNVEDRKTWEDAGFDAPHVYEDCANYGWLALFGDGKKNAWPYKNRLGKTYFLPWSKPQATRDPRGRPVQFFHWASNYAKDILGNLVSGTGQLELPDDLPEDYRKQLASEHKVPDGKGWRWEKLTAHTDNHFWDLMAMQVIFALIKTYIKGTEQQEEAAD